jgi:hypothetical protein
VIVACRDVLVERADELPSGFGTSRRGKLIRYEVNHPEWDVYPVCEFAAAVDWATLYGPEWAPMNGAAPASVGLATGSAVSVYPKG